MQALEESQKDWDDSACRKSLRSRTASSNVVALFWVRCSGFAALLPSASANCHEPNSRSSCRSGRRCCGECSCGCATLSTSWPRSPSIPRQKARRFRANRGAAIDFYQLFDFAVAFSELLTKGPRTEGSVHLRWGVRSVPIRPAGKMIWASRWRTARNSMSRSLHLQKSFLRTLKPAKCPQR